MGRFLTTCMSLLLVLEMLMLNFVHISIPWFIDRIKDIIYCKLFSNNTLAVILKGDGKRQ